MRFVPRVLAVAVGVGVLFGVGTAGAAADSHFGAVTCHGGTIASGTYKSLRIVGVCAVPTGGRVRVRGRVVVAPHGVLNAVSLSTFNVGGSVIVGDDAIAGLGCSSEAGCSSLTNDHIGGNLTATGATAVVVQQERIAGNATIRGGGGNMNCTSTVFFGGPYFSTIEDSSVGGNIRIQAIHSCWFGMFRLHVGGNVTVTGNRMGDPDGNEITTNTIGGNLACFNNSPKAQFGDAAPVPNIVGGKKLGECATL
jgi:hypothetical protein